MFLKGKEKREAKGDSSYLSPPPVPPSKISSPLAPKEGLILRIVVIAVYGGDDKTTAVNIKIKGQIMA